MKILKEESARDPEIASLLESANGDPRAVEAKIRERFETKRRRFIKSSRVDGAGVGDVSRGESV